MVGRAGHVRHDPGAGIWDRTRVPVLHIADGEPPSSTLYRGPFRVHLLALHRRRNLDFGGSAGREPSSQGRALCRSAGVRRTGPIPGLRRTASPRGHGRPGPSCPARTRRTPSGLDLTPHPRTSRARSGSSSGGSRSASPIAQAVELKRLRGTLPVIVSAARPELAGHFPG